MPEPLLAVRGLVKRFGALVAIDHLALAVMPGELHALIGPKGAGKTTRLGQLAGELRPDAGSICFAGHEITPLPAHRRVALGLATFSGPAGAIGQEILTASCSASTMPEASWAVWRPPCSRSMTS